MFVFSLILSFLSPSIYILRRSSGAVATGQPGIGETLQLISAYKTENPEPFIDERVGRYGPVFTTHLFGEPTVFSADPDTNRFILQNEGVSSSRATPAPHEHEEIRLKRGETDALLWEDYKSMSFTQRVSSLCYTIPKGWKVFASFRGNYSGATNMINMFNPFGGGPRRCPGAELARVELSVFLHRLVTQFRLNYLMILQLGGDRARQASFLSNDKNSKEVSHQHSKAKTRRCGIKIIESIIDLTFEEDI
ncbi:hypothetical protein SASPL_104883 [Salvia splendens]|uniref:Uncharacterized protein n=1 Tax=Salvia splendens TaxID=180675 RepID=A0A8X8YI10_SALSN|nr:hypothetical protein SASPL_104883 [Salvia splendens]